MVFVFGGYIWMITLININRIYSTLHHSMAIKITTPTRIIFMFRYCYFFRSAHIFQFLFKASIPKKVLGPNKELYAIWLAIQSHVQIQLARRSLSISSKSSSLSFLRFLSRDSLEKSWNCTSCFFLHLS